MTRLALIALCLATPLAAQEKCGPGAGIFSRLGAQYGESQRTGGFVNEHKGNVLVVFANDATGTWTVLELNPDGTACVISSGDGWTDLAGPRSDAPL